MQIGYEACSIKVEDYECKKDQVWSDKGKLLVVVPSVVECQAESDDNRQCSVIMCSPQQLESLQ